MSLDREQSLTIARRLLLGLLAFVGLSLRYSVRLAAIVAVSWLAAYLTEFSALRTVAKYLREGAVSGGQFVYVVAIALADGALLWSPYWPAFVLGLGVFFILDIVVLRFR